MKRSLLGITVLALALSGCAAADTAETGSYGGSSMATSAPDKGSDSVSMEDLGHVHSVETDGKEFFLASHHGLYVLDGDSWVMRGEEFDVMGLDTYNGIFYASGHPGAQQNYPDPLGILTSEDQGKTWNPQVLLGEVDFHVLKVAGTNRIGIAANYGAIIASQDSGETWYSVEVGEISGISINPLNPNEVMVAVNGSLQLSSNLGQSFEPIESPMGVRSVEWGSQAVLVASSSTIFAKEKIGDSFTPLSRNFRNITSLSSSAESIMILDDEGVHISDDAGKSFRTVLLPE